MGRNNLVRLIRFMGVLIFALIATAGTLGSTTVSAISLIESHKLPGMPAVQPDVLTITANDVVKNYGKILTLTGTEFTVSGLKPGDAVTRVTLTSAGTAADAWPGTYAIVPSNAIGSGLENYAISYVNGTLTIPLIYPPRRISLATPPSAAASVGSPLATQPVVLVRDRNNNPVSQVTVTASRGQGTGTLRGHLTAVSDSKGLATFTDLGYNKSGEIFTIRFAAGSLSINSSSLGPISSGAPSALAIDRPPVAGTSVDANLPDQPRIKVTDQYNNPVSGAEVTVSLASGPGTLRGTLTAVSNAAGLAAFTDLGYDKAGEKFSLHFTLGDLSVDSGSMGPLAPGAATQLRVETAANGSGTTVPAQTLAADKTLTVYGITRDRFNNYVAAAAGTWSLVNKSGSIRDTDLVTAVDQKSATLTASHSGSAMIHFSSGDLTSLDSGRITVRTSKIIRGTGGGGGGSSPPPTLKTNGFVPDPGLIIGTDGVRAEALQLKTSDGRLTLDIAAKTRLLNQSGGPLTQLTISPLAKPAPTAERSTILLAYELGPDGATFNPPLVLTVKYPSLPEGIDEKSIRVVRWNGFSWQDLGGGLNLGSGIVTASISHFSQYAVVADLLQSSRVAIRDPLITPAKANEGQPAAVPPVTILSSLPGSTGAAQPTPAPASTPSAAPANLNVPRPTASQLPVNDYKPQSNWLLVMLVTVLGAGAVVTLAMVLSRRKPGN